MKTLKCIMEIKDRCGNVNTMSLQRHTPECDMCFILLDSGHFLFCQKNHPVVINDDDLVFVVNAENIHVGDKIFVNNETCFNKNSKIPHTNPKDVFNAVLNLSGKINSIDRFKPDFINSDKTWVCELLSYFESTPLILSSISLIQQLKLLSDRSEIYNFDISPYYLDDDLFFKLEINKNNCGKINGCTSVIKCELCKGYKRDVYDIKTCSGSFLNNCVQTHNSFHTGGAIIFHHINYLDELMANVDEIYRDDIKKKIKQDLDDLYTESDVTMISIDKTLFYDDPIREDSDCYVLPLGYFSLLLDGIPLKIGFERETKIFKTDIVEINDTYITITFNKGDKICWTRAEREDYQMLAREFDTYCGGKSVFTSPENLYKKFFRKFSHTGNYDTVHLEVVVSNVLRSSADPQKPARLVEPYSYTTFSIKKLPNIISYRLGLAFENFGSALRYGLISKGELEPSPIEKVMIGMPLVDTNSK